MLWSYSIPYDNSNSAPSRLVSHLFHHEFAGYNSRTQNLPWCNTSPRWFPGEFSQHAICLIEDVSLLLDGHVHWVLVAIPVQSDLVTSIAYGCHVFGKRLQTVPWDEPSCFDVVLSLIRCCSFAHSASRTFLNIFRSRCVPTVPAKIPRLMSLVLSSPPYDPSQPETASTSTP
jgi:hypothetical protein